MERFYICKHCGNIVGMIHSSGVPIKCCGEDMVLIEPNTVDASTEKHIPVVTVDGDTVTAEVGSVVHPMSAEHSIQWIYLQTDKGGMRIGLTPDEKPVAKFTLNGAKPVAVYAYCNLHGLWKKEL